MGHRDPLNALITRRVLFLSQSSVATGGVETWLRWIISCLPRHGWIPSLALVNGARGHNARSFQRTFGRTADIVIDGWGLCAEERREAILRVIRATSPEVFCPLIVHDGHVAAAQLGQRSCDTRYLYILHSMAPQSIADLLKFAPSIDLAVAPGQFAYKALHRVGLPAERIRIAPNGALQSVGLVSRKHPSSVLQIGYVGRVSRAAKRAHEIVDLVRHLDELHVRYQIHVVGTGDALSYLQAELFGKHVTFHGEVDQRWLAESFYGQLDCLFFPSDFETFGITLVEAMRFGVVPICADYVGRRAEGLVENGRNGLVFPVGDASAAARLILELRDTSGMFQSLSDGALASVAGRYSWQDCVSEFAAALDASIHLPKTGTRALPEPGIKSSHRSAVIRLLRQLRGRLFSRWRQNIEDGWPWTGRHDSEDLATALGILRSCDTVSGTGMERLVTESLDGSWKG